MCSASTATGSGIMIAWNLLLRSHRLTMTEAYYPHCRLPPFGRARRFLPVAVTVTVLFQGSALPALYA
jgi:hypothetical protein